MIEINLDFYVENHGHILAKAYNEGFPKLDKNKQYILFANEVLSITYSYFAILFKGWTREEIKNSIFFDLPPNIQDKIDDYLYRIDNETNRIKL